MTVRQYHYSIDVTCKQCSIINSTTCSNVRWYIYLYSLNHHTCDQYTHNYNNMIYAHIIWGAL